MIAYVKGGAPVESCRALGSKMKNALLRLCAALCLVCGLAPCIDVAHGAPRSVSLKKGSLFGVAPIRRIGILPVRSNIPEWRRLFDGSFADPEGTAVVNMPLSSKQMTDYLTTALEQVVETNGRFTAATLATDLNEKASQVEKDLDLDGILLSEVKFDADRAEFKLWLKPRKDVHANWLEKSTTLVRENISLDLRFTERELIGVFSQLLARLVSSLGYEGQVTSLRDQIALLDFGKETGLEKGDLVELGFVVPEEIHPVTQEVLRTQKVAFYQAQVLEVRLGSSLAELVTEDRQKLLEWRQRGASNNVRYFAWKSPLKKSLVAEKQVAIEGMAVSGFKELKSLKREEAPKTGGRALAPESYADSKETNAEDLAEMPEEKSSSSDFDLAKIPLELSKSWLGFGMDFGTLGTDLGDRYTSFPGTVLNYLSLDIPLKGPQNLTFIPRAALSFYSGGDVKGYNAQLGLAVFSRMPEVNSGFSAGAALQAGFGEAKTIRVTRSLSDFSIFGLAKWTSPKTSWGTLEPELGVSLLGIFSGNLGIQSKITMTDFSAATKGFGVFLGYERSNETWSQIRLGGLWNFGEHRP
jgi:hypothetical protein